VIDEPNKNKLYLYIDQDEQYDLMMKGCDE